MRRSVRQNARPVRVSFAPRIAISLQNSKGDFQRTLWSALKNPPLIISPLLSALAHNLYTPGIIPALLAFGDGIQQRCDCLPRHKDTAQPLIRFSRTVEVTAARRQQMILRAEPNR